MPGTRATCNTRKELPAAAAAALIHRIASQADVIGWQEIETDAHRDAADSLPHHDTYWPGGRYRIGKRRGHPKNHPANAVPISYDTRVFKLRFGSKKQLHGGQRGVTPARYLTWVVLEHLEDGTWECHENTHLIQKAFTDAPSHRARWNSSATIIERVIARHVKRWGGAIGGGDLNRSRFTFTGTRANFALHGTHGTAYYDQVWTAGNFIPTAPARRVVTASDHDALVLPYGRRKR